MRATRTLAGTVLGTSLALAACSGGQPSASAPTVQELGSRTHVYRSLTELAADANAIVIARPTGATSAKPFPHGGRDAAPTQYVRMHVTRVLSGTVSSRDVDVANPGDDDATQRPVLLSRSSFVLFLTPAMYAADDPAGGYAVVGGPAGVYSVAGSGSRYVRVDRESPDLPSSVTVDVTSLPQITASERQLLHRGPAR